MDQEAIDYYKIGYAVGALTISVICGLVPLKIGSREGLPVIGVLGFIACVVVGFLFGGIFAALTAILCSIIIYSANSYSFGCSVVCFAVMLGVGGYYYYYYSQTSQQFASSPSVDFTGVVREFKASDGRRIIAKLISFDGVNVKVERSDGKIFENPIKIYSPEDQEFIRKAFLILK